MATITLEGNEIHTNGELPAVGTQAPDFRLTASDMTDKTLADFAGKKKILNIVVSLETSFCEVSTKKFNDEAGDDTDVLAISVDYPIAQTRVVEAVGADKVVTLSMLRSKNFAKDYGVLIQDGPLEGICARAVVVLDENNKVLYTELVPEIAQAPDYEKALAALQ
jgi:thiol peroxidase